MPNWRIAFLIYLISGAGCSAISDRSSPLSETEPPVPEDADALVPNTKTYLVSNNQRILTEPQILLGLDTATGEMRPPCLEFVDKNDPDSYLPRNPRPTTQRPDFNAGASVDRFLELTKNQTSAAFSIADIVGLSGALELVQLSTITKYSAFLLATNVVTKEPFVVNTEKEKLRLNSFALEILRKEDGGRLFLETCGDSFIEGWTPGGRLLIAFTSRAQTRQQRESISHLGTAGAWVDVFTLRGNSSSNRTVLRTFTALGLELHAYVEGPSEGIPLNPRDKPPRQLDRLIAYNLEFADLVSRNTGNQWKIGWRPRSFQDLAIPELEKVKAAMPEYRDRMQTAERAGHVLVSYFDRKADLKYIAENPGNPNEFGRFDRDKLNTEIQNLDPQISELRDSARDCTRLNVKCDIAKKWAFQKRTPPPGLTKRFPNVKSAASIDVRSEQTPENIPLVIGIRGYWRQGRGGAICGAGCQENGMKFYSSDGDEIVTAPPPDVHLPANVQALGFINEKTKKDRQNNIQDPERPYSFLVYEPLYPEDIPCWDGLPREWCPKP